MSKFKDILRTIYKRWKKHAKVKQHKNVHSRVAYLLLFQDCSDQSDSHGQGRHSLSQNFTEKMFFACVP